MAWPMTRVFPLGLVLAMATTSFGAVITSNVTFSGPAQHFGMGLAVNGSVSVNGNGTFHLLDSGIIRSHKSISIPAQTQPLSLPGGVVNVNSQPVGSATMITNNRNLGEASISNLNVNLLNGSALNLSLNPIVFDVNIETIGHVGLRVQIVAALTNLTFQSNPGTSSAVPFYAVPGQLSATLSARATAVAQDVIGGADFDLGEIANTSATDSTDFTLFGVTTLTDLGAPYPSNVGLNMNLSLPITLPFGLSTSGSDSQVEGHGTGNVDLFLNYSLNANLALSNLNYSLRGTIENAYLPEVPSTYLVFAALALGLALQSRRHQRIPRA